MGQIQRNEANYWSPKWWKNLFHGLLTLKASVSIKSLPGSPGIWRSEFCTCPELPQPKDLQTHCLSCNPWLLKGGTAPFRWKKRRWWWRCTEPRFLSISCCKLTIGSTQSCTLFQSSPAPFHFQLHIVAFCYNWRAAECPLHTCLQSRGCWKAYEQLVMSDVTSIPSSSLWWWVMEIATEGMRQGKPTAMFSWYRPVSSNAVRGGSREESNMSSSS